MEHIKGTLKDAVDFVAKKTFGISKTEAQEKGICVKCKLPALPRTRTEAGAREYHSSGMCEICYDTMSDNIGGNDA